MSQTVFRSFRLDLLKLVWLQQMIGMFERGNVMNRVEVKSRGMEHSGGKGEEVVKGNNEEKMRASSSV